MTLKRKSIAGSESQIARRASSTGNIDEADREEIKKSQDTYEGIRKILFSLSKFECCPGRRNEAAPKTGQESQRKGYGKV